MGFGEARLGRRLTDLRGGQGAARRRDHGSSVSHAPDLSEKLTARLRLFHEDVPSFTATSIVFPDGLSCIYAFRLSPERRFLHLTLGHRAGK